MFPSFQGDRYASPAKLASSCGYPGCKETWFQGGRIFGRREHTRKTVVLFFWNGKGREGGASC